ncbi:MAG: cytochrome c peroxidase, partial [Maribacter sp.]
MKKLYILFFTSLLLTNCSSKEEEIYTPIPYNLEIPTLFAEKLIAPII